MKATKVIGIISALISMVFFALMLGFIGGLELDTVSFISGTFGAFASLFLWLIWLVLADMFLGGGL